MSVGLGKTAASGDWMIKGVVWSVLAFQVLKFSDGVFDRSVFAFADSLFVLIFSGLLCWSFAHGYRWARFGLAYFALAMFAISGGSLLSFGEGTNLISLVSALIYFVVFLSLLFPPLAMLAALEIARTSPLGPDEILGKQAARRRGRRILVTMIAAAILAQATWMLPAWWRMGTEPGLTEVLIISVIAAIALGLWRRSENARAWAWLLSFGACIWFLALGVFAPEPNDFFIAIGLAHLAIPSALVSWRSVQVYFGDKDLDAKWEYVQPTPRRPKAWGEARDDEPVVSTFDTPKRGS